jgi:hypothetical protein
MCNPHASILSCARCGRRGVLGLRIHYCRSELHAVEKALKDFLVRLEATPDLSLALVVSFYTQRQRKAKSLWELFSSPFDDRAVFETWKLQVDVKEDSECAVTHAVSQTRERMQYILKQLNKKTSHLPTDPSQYRFDFTFSQPVTGGWSPRNIAQSIRSIPFIT